MRTLRLKDGTAIPALGLGTWMMGEGRRSRREEVAALKTGIDAGMTLVDTAEMYGSGASEELVAEAIAGRPDEVFLVSKVLPSNASRRGTVRACEESLKRLRTDRLDLYLLHWRGGVPLAETVEALSLLAEEGKIARWGVSNFDVDDMEELMSVPGGNACVVNQVLYNLEERGPEFDLFPWQDERGIVTMAYSPLGHDGALLEHPVLRQIAERHGVSPAAVALAFATARPGVMAIPKAGSAAHVEENAKGAAMELSGDDRAALDAAFPPPSRKRPLSMI
ncbi:aldo/keto reductase [Consotaella salsifontis]|uniref:Aldo/keto reductase n=1 Tax=Consotaella salsifontis TaxID=1365950 RepID=A0A1T4SC59_9HYPH|nr:aldo/keto reductase [Consotaella salsifontis]SKA25782.1 Aldo/keto reductase [Consotaella salsifontis]